jgi:hypothetical protein
MPHAKKLKRTRKQGLAAQIERKIVTGLIVDNQFAREAKIFVNADQFKLEYASIVANWCLEYINKYGSAPKQNIQDLFATKTIDIDPETIETITEFLANINEEYIDNNTQFNSSHALDQAQDYIRKRNLEAHKEEISKAIVSNDLESGEQAIASFTRAERMRVHGINPLYDSEAIRRALHPEYGERLFCMPGDLGWANGYWERGHFHLIVAPKARGKSWWLQEIGILSVYAGLKVLVVNLEMTEPQSTRRILQRVLGRPYLKKHAGEIIVPIADCVNNQDNSCKKGCRRGLLTRNGQKLEYGKEPKGYKPCTKCRGTADFIPAAWYKTINRKVLEYEESLRKMQALHRTVLRSGRFKMINPPPNTLKVSQLIPMIENWGYYEDFIPDVIITDYIEKFKNENTRELGRDAIYTKTLNHKMLASYFNCLVASGSQSNTAREEEKDIRDGDVADDIRKMNEVDTAWSLNQKKEEKRRGIMRASLMKHRHDDFDSRLQVMVYQCLKIGRPLLDSCTMRFGR